MHQLSIHSFPKAVLHVDGDSFFASCEVAKNPALKGKPVITGKERGIASSMTYEAKALGVTRAMSLSEIRRICPDAIILPSDYETYSLFSKRMYEIVRRYTDAIEEYSIDECFADLTGMRRPNKMSYEEMATNVKSDLDSELGMTFSVGLSINKVLAKVASKWKKPSGLTIIPGYNIHLYLSKLPVSKVWGIGPQTSAYLNSLGINTAYEFAMKDKDWVRTHFSKPVQEIHEELNGGYVYPLVMGEKHDYASISKTKTFTPASSNRDYVMSQLSKNVENACIKLRRHGLYAKRIAFFLKTQDFRYTTWEIRFSQPLDSPNVILDKIREQFHRVYSGGVLYRATGIVMMDLGKFSPSTLDLFDAGSALISAKMSEIYAVTDKIDEKYGKHTVFLGSSFKALQGRERHRNLAIPFLGEVR